MLVKIKFTDKQLEKIADLLGDIGLIAIVSIVIPTLIDKFKLTYFIWGLIVVVFVWFMSLKIISQVKE